MESVPLPTYSLKGGRIASVKCTGPLGPCQLGTGWLKNDQGCRLCIWLCVIWYSTLQWGGTPFELFAITMSSSDLTFFLQKHMHLRDHWRRKAILRAWAHGWKYQWKGAQSFQYAGHSQIHANFFTQTGRNWKDGGTLNLTVNWAHQEGTSLMLLMVSTTKPRLAEPIRCVILPASAFLLNRWESHCACLEGAPYKPIAGYLFKTGWRLWPPTRVIHINLRQKVHSNEVAVSKYETIWIRRFFTNNYSFYGKYRQYTTIRTEV